VIYGCAAQHKSSISIASCRRDSRAPSIVSVGRQVSTHSAKRRCCFPCFRRATLPPV
jgi:hypothetical protein